jgi:hypothetical protein
MSDGKNYTVSELLGMTHGAALALADAKYRGLITAPLPEISQQDIDNAAEFQRVWNSPPPPPTDPNQVPVLLSTVRNDLDTERVDHAAWDLGYCKSKAAITGLIDCLGVSMEGRSRGNHRYRPCSEDFWDEFASCLRHATGQPIGTDKKAWQYWWRTKGVHRADLE